MLRVYSDYLGVLRGLGPCIARIEQRDADLARQLRRAAASVALNLAEGSGSQGGTRRQRYLTALGSAQETRACLEVADALGYVAANAGVMRALDGVCAVVAKLAR